MFDIYNESQNPWKVKTTPNITVLSRNVRSFIKDDDATKFQTGLSLLLHKNVIVDPELLNQTIQRSVRASERTIQLLNIPSNVIFNQKAFRPFIVRRPNEETIIKQFLAATILLRGRRIVNVRNNDTYILETFTKCGEFSFIISLIPGSGVFSFDLYDPANPTNSEHYEFSTYEDHGNRRISVKRSPVRVVIDNHNQVKMPIRFRPARPTHAIICSERDQELMMTQINPEHHNIFIANKDNFVNIAKSIKNDSYNAVTIYVPMSKASFLQEKNKNAHKYRELADSISSRFMLINILATDGVVKYKY